MTSWERITSQFTSGRWLLTVISGLCLLGMTLTDCYVAYVQLGRHASAAGPIALPFSVEALLAIITAVFMAYFGKTPTNGNGNGNGNDDKLTTPEVPPHQP